MKRTKSKALKEFFMQITDVHHINIPRDVLEGLVCCFVYNDEDSSAFLMYNLCEWYKSLPSHDPFKNDLDFYIETLASEI